MVKEKDKEEIEGESPEDNRIWVCPKCGTRYWGWSALNTCSKCGYK